MGDNTIATVSNGEVASEEKWNQYKTALVGDILPRNTSGAVTNGAADIGSSSYKFAEAHVTDIYAGAGAKNLSESNHEISNSSGNFSTSNYTTETAVTNLEITITTHGRPVVLMIVGDNSANDAFYSPAYEYLYRDSSKIGNGSGSTGSFFDSPVAGTYTYTIKTKASYILSTVGVSRYQYLKLLAYEL